MPAITHRFGQSASVDCYYAHAAPLFIYSCDYCCNTSAVTAAYTRLRIYVPVIYCKFGLQGSADYCHAYRSEFRVCLRTYYCYCNNWELEVNWLLLFPRLSIIPLCLLSQRENRCLHADLPTDNLCFQFRASGVCRTLLGPFLANWLFACRFAASTRKS